MNTCNSYAICFYKICLALLCNVSIWLRTVVTDNLSTNFRFSKFTNRGLEWMVKGMEKILKIHSQEGTIFWYSRLH